MLSSIHPLGERARGNRFNHTATAFIFGSLAGGGLIGLTLGASGWVANRFAHLVFDASLEPALGLLAVALAGVVALVFELSGKRVPSVRRQVNEDWLAEFRGWVYGIGFGLQLGAGVATYITSTAVLVWLVSMFVAGLVHGSVVGSVAIGSTFGLVRGLSILTTRSIQSPDQLVRFHRVLHRSTPHVQRLGTVSLVFLTVTAGVLAAQNMAS